MSEQENKRLVRRFIDEVWNQRKIDLADELIASDCITHQLRSPADTAGSPRSPEAVKQEAAAWLAAFPDLHLALEQMIAANDLVVSRCTIHGTHRGGDWMGIAPTGRKIEVPMIVIHRIDGGKIVEDWVLIGSLLLFQQLGLVPDTATIVARS